MRTGVEADIRDVSSTADPTGELLDEYYGEHDAPLEGRELVSEAAFALALALAAGSFALLVPPRSTDGGLVVALAAAYATASVVKFHVGACFLVPTQLVLVPIVLLLPPALVVPVVVSGLVLGTLPGVIRGRQSPTYLVVAASDAWHALGPAVVVASIGSPPFRGVDALGVFAAAFVAQAALDSGTIVLRQWIGRGIPPRRQGGLVGAVQLVDALLWPIGLLAAYAAFDAPFTWLLALSLVGLLALLARDRRRLIATAQDRLCDIHAERARRDEALRRVGEAFATTLDADAVLQLTLATALDAVHADHGRAVATGGRATGGLEPRHQPVAVEAEDAARASGGAAEARHDDLVALACPLLGHDGESVAVLCVIRTGASFDADERLTLTRLASQAVVSLEHARLHAQLSHQASTDALTGLSNHRRLHERLERELAAGGQLALVMLDLDDFKQVNDVHGHQVGDQVLESVANALRASCRDGDEPARPGGEEFAVVLACPVPDGGRAVAERIRREIERIAIHTSAGAVIRPTASIGVAVLGPATRSARTLVEAADAALYAAKARGKNCVVSSDELVPVATLRP